MKEITHLECQLFRDCSGICCVEINERGGMLFKAHGASLPEMNINVIVSRRICHRYSY